MTQNLDVLLSIAELKKARDLAVLAKIQGAQREIETKQSEIRDQSRRGKDTKTLIEWPGREEKWLENLRRKEAGLRAELANLAPRCEAAQRVARNSFGRAEVIRQILQRGKK